MMKSALRVQHPVLPGVFIAFAALLLATPAHAHFTMTFNGASGQPASWQEDAFTVTGNWTPDGGVTINPGTLQTGTWLAGGAYIASAQGQSSNWLEFTRQGVPFTPLNFQIAQRSGAQTFIASTGAQLNLTGGVGDTFQFPLNDLDWTDLDWLVLYTQSGSLGIDSFTMSVCPDPRILGPYSVAEGGAVLVSGYAEGNNAQFSWDLDNDGSYGDALGTSTLFSTAVDGPATHTIGLEVTADCGLSGTVTGSTTTTVSVTNVAPSIDSLVGDSGGDEGELLGWTLTWSDPGVLDSHTVHWDPGDGSGPQSGGDSFTYSYVEDGSYALIVTITDSDGGSASDNVSVQVDNVAPQLSNLSVPSGTEGSLLSFSVVASDPGAGDLLDFLWDLGDGTTIDGDTTVQHSYADDGSYTVSFTASDDDGGSNTVSATAAVSNLNPQITQLVVPSAAVEGDVVALSAVAADVAADPLSYTWDFGDGSAAQTGNPNNYSWEDEGSYYVQLTVADDDGGSTQGSAVIGVSNAGPSIDQSNFPGGLEGELLSFSVQASDPGSDTLSYSWDFGDGTAAASGATPDHSFADEGSYTVSLTVSDGDGGSQQVSQTVQILNAAPNIDNITGNTSGLEAQNLSWTALVSDPGSNDTVTGIWDFGDGSAPVPGLSASHSFDDNGTYLVTFTATDNDGGATSDSLSVTISNEGPSITSINVPSGDEGELLTFSGSAIDAGNDTLIYSWDFGDGTPAGGGDSTSHTYADDGNYLVTLVVTDEDNGTATATGSALINNLAPQLTQVTAPATGDEGQSLSFEATASDPGATDNASLVFTWDFGDGSAPQIGASQNHAFPDNGTWQIDLLVDDGEGGTDTQTLSIDTQNVAPSIISQPPPIAIEGVFFSYLPNVIEPGTDTLTWSLAPSAPAGVVLNPSTGRITWTPEYSDALLGSAALTLQVFDGDGGSDLQSWSPTVSFSDDDNDGMADGWELLNGLDPNTAADAALDPDNDGLSNAEEFLAGSDPQGFDGPGLPTLLSPIDDEEVATASPHLVAGYAVDPQGDALSYEFEVYLDAALTQLLASGSSASAPSDEASWKVETPLPENSTVYWRARADDGAVTGPFSGLAGFFVNHENDTPSVPLPAYPLADETVSSAAVVLQWMLADDPDRDLLSYTLSVRNENGVVVDQGETDLLDENAGPSSSWTVTAALEEDGLYSWQVAAVDEHGAQGAWSEPEGFFLSQVNGVPQGTRFISPGNGDEITELSPVLSAAQGIDPDDEIIECLFETDPAEEFGSSEYFSYSVPAEADGIIEWDLAATGVELVENLRIYARVRCFDSYAAGSAPDIIEFFVRGENDPPQPPTLLSPSAGSQLAARSTLLQAVGHGDPEHDLVFYEFVVARDESLSEVLDSSAPVRPGAQDVDGAEPISWSTNTLSGDAFWSARGIDEFGAAGEWAAPRALSFAEEPVVEEPAGGCSANSSLAARGRPNLLTLVVFTFLLARRRRQGSNQPGIRDPQLG